MVSGLKTLHQIDAALAKSRANAAEAASLSQRATEAAATARAEQAECYNQIARDRLDLIEAGGGGALGYVDRQVEKHLAAHRKAVAKHAKAVDAAEAKIKTLEAQRRDQETVVTEAVDSYDKTVAKSEAALLKDPDYLAQIEQVEQAESTLQHALDKLAVAKTDEAEKGKPYREDAFFNYLQNRRYGTDEAKGWFLTKALDHWVARVADYRQAAENYRRLTAIPTRLAAHCESLEAQIGVEQDALATIEAKKLKSDGVSAARKTSVDAQAKLDKIDAQIETAEHRYQAALAAHDDIASGNAGPMKTAMDSLEAALAKMDRRSLQRLAAQTQTLTDDNAIAELRELSDAVRELDDDRSEAARLLKKYRSSQKQLEAVRARFKSRRYDAPSSSFKNSDKIARVLGQLLVGAVSGKDLWRTIERAQRTVRRYSDTDFGGIDWEDAFRIPRSSGRGGRSGGIGLEDILEGVILGGGSRSGGWGGGARSGGWGGGGTRSRRRTRTSLPRMPRQRLPRRSSGGGFGGFGGGSRGRSGGGFRTGGGF